jgi:hypothetical protein
VQSCRHSRSNAIHDAKSTSLRRAQKCRFKPVPLAQTGADSARERRETSRDTRTWWTGLRLLEKRRCVPSGLTQLTPTQMNTNGCGGGLAAPPGWQRASTPAGIRISLILRSLSDDWAARKKVNPRRFPNSGKWRQACRRRRKRCIFPLRVFGISARNSISRSTMSSLTRPLYRAL